MNFFNRYKKIEKLAAAITPRPIASRFFSKKIIFSLGLILLITGFFGNIEKTKAENLVVKSGQWTYKPDTKTWVYGKDKDVAPNAAGDLTAWGVSDDNAFAGIKTDLGTNNGFTFIGPGGQPNTNFGTSAMERVVGRSSQSGVFIGAPWNDTFKKIENGDPSIAQSLKTAGDLYTKVGSDGTMIVMKAGKNGIPDVLSASSPDDTVVGVVTTDGNTVKYSVFNDNIKNSTDQTTIKNAVNTYVQSQNGYLTSNSTNYDSVSGAAYQNQYGTTKTQYELTQENSNLTNQAVQLQKELEALQDEEETGVDNSAAIAAKQAEIEALTDKITANNNTVASTTSKAKNQSYTNSTTNDGLCWRGLTSSVGVLDLGNCLSQIAYYILSVFSWAVGIAGWLLNNIIEYTVVNIRDNLNQINAINTGWTVIRDLVNIFFIFILLYIAISTILGLDEHGAKHALAKVVIFGILINFSMFFTKVIIDTSNIFTLQFYSKITTANNQHMGEAIMAAFNTPGIYNTSGTNNSGNVSSNNAQNFAASSQHTLVVFIMGTIMLCTAAGVLVGASWIFLKRFVVFIFLLISSPVAFAGMILHSTEHHTKAWWSALMAEIIAAPVLMIMLWLAFSLIGGGGTGSKAGIISSLVSTAGNDTSSGAVQTLANAIGFNIFFNFAIVTALFSFALVAAQKLGASGSDGALKAYGGVMGAFKGAGSWAGKNTIGAGAYNLLEKTEFGTKRLKQLRQHSNPLVRGFGRMLVGGLQKVGHGHHEDVEKDMKDLEDTLNELRDDPAAKAKFLAKQMSGKAKMGGMMYPYNQKIAKYVTVGMKEDELATTALFMQNQGAAGSAERKEGEEGAKKMLSYLSKEKQKAVQEMMDNRATKYHSIKVGEEADKMGEYDSKLREYAKTRKISIDLGHGQEKVLEGKDARDHLRDLQNARSATQQTSVAKLKEMFKNFGDRQKTEIFGTLSRSEQLALARSDEFNDVLAENLVTYQDAENARKAGLVKELGQKIMDTSYQKLSRIKIFHALDTGKDHAGQPLTATARIGLMDKWIELAPKIIDRRTGAVTGSMDLDAYKKSKERSADQTFSNADRNFSRMGEVSKEWNELVEQIKAAGLDLNALEVPRTK